MSGVYIPGMEIPKRGGISVYIWSSGTVDSANGIYQAISVPDHGRLGDLDALADKCDDPHWCVWLSDIEDAPTIIPASGKEGEA